MCEKCEEIDAKIARYRQQLGNLTDPTAIALVDLVIAVFAADVIRLRNAGLGALRPR